jgi:hypothetical protein
MPEVGVVCAALLGIARDVRDERALAGLICQACVDGLDVDGAAMSLFTTQLARHTLASTDATADLLEELQFTLNEGACIEAATTGSPVLVPDLDHAGGTRGWPVFAAAVLERSNARALFALPLQWGPVNLGVIDLYRTQPGALSGEQQRDAFAAAEVAGLMMLTLRTDPAITPDSPDNPDNPDSGTEAWLEPSIGSRAVVHQATGMVLMQLDSTAEVALARMRAEAFVEGRLLIDVARDVVARRVRFTAEHPPPR